MIYLFNSWCFSSSQTVSVPGGISTHIPVLSHHYPIIIPIKHHVHRILEKKTNIIPLLSQYYPSILISSHHYQLGKVELRGCRFYWIPPARSWISPWWCHRWVGCGRSTGGWCHVPLWPLGWSTYIKIITPNKQRMIWCFIYPKKRLAHVLWVDFWVRSLLEPVGLTIVWVVFWDIGYRSYIYIYIIYIYITYIYVYILHTYIYIYITYIIMLLFMYFVHVINIYIYIYMYMYMHVCLHVFLLI